LSATILVLLLL
jgi:hypothetical protein